MFRFQGFLGYLFESRLRLVEGFRVLRWDLSVGVWSLGAWVFCVWSSGLGVWDWVAGCTV